MVGLNTVGLLNPDLTPAIGFWTVDTLVAAWGIIKVLCGVFINVWAVGSVCWGNEIGGGTGLNLYLAVNGMLSLGEERSMSLGGTIGGGVNVMNPVFATSSLSDFNDSMILSFFRTSFFNFLMRFCAVFFVWLYVNSSSEIR